MQFFYGHFNYNRSIYTDSGKIFHDYFTLQFFFVLLAGILLGSKLGALAVLLYVVIGITRITIFAAGGGLAYIVRPSFGYLIGFIAGAYVLQA